MGVRWHFYTSGTTRDPKGVRHTDASITAAAIAVNDSVEIGARDRMGVVFPYTHVGGICMLVGAFVAGYGQILTEAFDPATTIPLLREHGVTIAGAGTVFWNAYLDAQAALHRRAAVPASAGPGRRRIGEAGRPERPRPYRAGRPGHRVRLRVDRVPELRAVLDRRPRRQALDRPTGGRSPASR